MHLSVRDGADRAFLLPPAPSDWDVVFAAPRLLPWYLPRVFAHLAHRLATATRDPLLGVARLAVACAMVSASPATYERDRRLFRPPPLPREAVDRFGPIVLAQGDAPKEATLRLLMAAWPHVPWGAVRRRLPYASQEKEPPLIPYAHRETLLSAERHWIGVLPRAGTPIGLGCTERALRAAFPVELPYVDVDEGGYGDASPSSPAARRLGGSHWGAPASSSWGAAVDTAAARGAAFATRGGESQRSDPGGGSAVGTTDDGGPASPGSTALGAPVVVPGAGYPTTRGTFADGGHCEQQRADRLDGWDRVSRGDGDPSGGGSQGWPSDRHDGGWGRPAGDGGGGAHWGHWSHGEGNPYPETAGDPVSRGDHSDRHGGWGRESHGDGGPYGGGSQGWHDDRHGGGWGRSAGDDGVGARADAVRRGAERGYASQPGLRDGDGRRYESGDRRRAADPAFGSGRDRGDDDQGLRWIK